MEDMKNTVKIFLVGGAVRDGLRDKLQNKETQDKVEIAVLDYVVTGATPVTLIGQDNVEYTVLKIDIRDVTVGIISNDEFSPKTTIQGFTAGIKKGFNLSNF